jgi:hypothetical protein
MWQESGMECYRFRPSGELLVLDEHGQCFEMTEVGAMPADFKTHYRRCTGTEYEYHSDAAGFEDDDPDLEEDDDLDDDLEEGGLERRGPPLNLPLPRLFLNWSEDSSIDRQQSEEFLARLRAFELLFRNEVEDTCNQLKHLTRQWFS